jgi:protein arginine kinase
MSWFTSEVKCSHYTVRSQTRYVRNLADLQFQGKADQKQIDQFFEKAEALLAKNGFRKETLPCGALPEVASFAEKGFIDRDFLLYDGKRSLFFNEPCSLAVALGGGDLISIRSLLAGNSIPETRNIAAAAEELLDREFEFAYSDTLGYISHSPLLCGSGIEFSALLYLPSLRLKKSSEALRYQCAVIGARLFPLTSCSDGDLYLLSHTPAPFSDEVSAARLFGILVSKIVEDEARADRIIFTEGDKIIIDRAWRAYGLLTNARMLSEAELLSLSSDLRLALAVCEDSSALPPVSACSLNLLLAQGLNSSVAAGCKECKSNSDCNHARAQSVHKILARD